MQPISSPMPHLPPETAIADSTAGRSSVRKAAEAFEALFLAEMLSHAGVGKPADALGGGKGEEAFQSFLTQAYVEKITATGRFGIAEAIVRASATEDPANG